MAATLPRRRGRAPALSVSLRYPSSFDVDPAASAAFIGQLTAAAGEGKDVTVVAPTVGSKDGRAKMTLALRAQGVPPEVTAVLGWATADGEADEGRRRSEPAAEVDRLFDSEAPTVPVTRFPEDPPTHDYSA